MSISFSKNKIMGLFVSIMLMVFCITKVLRGADVGSTSEGGIWNYISLAFFPLFLLYFVKKKNIDMNFTIISMFIFVLSEYFSLILVSNFSLDKTSLFLQAMVAVPFLVFACFYFYSGDNDYEKKILLFAYYVCLVINIVTIVKYQFFEYKRAMASDVYYSLCLFPFVLLFVKNKAVFITTTVIQLLTIFLSDKRTGFIAFVIALIVYFLITSNNNGRNNLIKTIKTLLICIASAVLIYFITRYIDDVYELDIYTRIFRIGEDQGSGRVSIYKALIESFNKSSLFDKFFGHGLGSIKEVCGSPRAHNDFLEVLYTYGVISLVTFLFFECSLLVETINMFKRKSEYAPAMLFSLIIGLFLSMFSFFLCYFTYVTSVVAFWGYVLAMEEKRVSTITNRLE